MIWKTFLLKTPKSSGNSVEFAFLDAVKNYDSHRKSWKKEFIDQTANLINSAQ